MTRPGGFESPRARGNDTPRAFPYRSSWGTSYAVTKRYGYPPMRLPRDAMLEAEIADLKARLAALESMAEGGTVSDGR